MDSIAAVDIGSTKTVTVIADVDGRLVTRVVAVGVAPCRGLKAGTVVDLEDTAQSVVQSVRRAEQMANRKISDVTISVTGEHISGENSQGIVPIVPPGRTITREDVNRVINHSKQIVLPADRELIHAIPRVFTVDGQDGVMRPFGMSGERLEVSTFLVSGQLTHIENLERCVHRAQIQVESVVHSPIASGLAVLDKSEMDAGTIVVDLGGGTTGVAGFVGGSIAFTHVLPVGANHVTSDLSKLLRTTPEEAERLKVSEATCDSEAVSPDETVPVQRIGEQKPMLCKRKVMAEIIEARVRETLAMVKNAVDQSGYAGQIAGGYVFTGGGSKLRGLASLATRVFGDVPVRVAPPANLGGLSDMVSGPEHATVVGLVKYSLRMREEETVAAESPGLGKLWTGITGIFGGKGAKTQER
jgi:cell division protein FtsA